MPTGWIVGLEQPAAIYQTDSLWACGKPGTNVWLVSKSDEETSISTGPDRITRSLGTITTPIANTCTKLVSLPICHGMLSDIDESETPFTKQTIHREVTDFLVYKSAMMVFFQQSRLGAIW